MINERRVKELCHMAVYDTGKDKTDQQMGQYYLWDYVSKELIKSFFSGTIAYLLLVLLWAMSSLERVSMLINNLNVLGLAVSLVVLYIGFMAVYLFVTAVVYSVRFANGRKRLKKYEEHMAQARRLYHREDQQKS